MIKIGLFQVDVLSGRFENSTLSTPGSTVSPHLITDKALLRPSCRGLFKKFGRQQFATPRNGTVGPLFWCHSGCMLHKKTWEMTVNATRADVNKEMAKPARPNPQK
jgi:hypothetical protein